MTNKLINSRLGAVLPDPTLSLKTFLSTNWSVSTGYTVPTSSAVKFDTKFGSGKGFFNFVLVEEMPKKITPQTVGSGRYTNVEVKRIQILCIGTTAKITKWNMERHIDSLINGNPTGLQTTYGIDWFNVTDFVEIPTSENDTVITDLQPNTGFQKARSTALVNMRYETEATTV